MSSSVKSRKRVRFSDQPQIREFEPARVPEPESSDLQDLEGGIDAVHLTSVDPVKAASDRAKRRRDALLLTFEDGMDGDELAAEAEYEDIPVSSRLEHAARLEPFHMKRERELGYFDAETGDYVEYGSRRDVPDAWADALPVIETMEDEDDSESGEEAELDVGTGECSDPAALRHIIVHALREGETVLSALRRIGRERAMLPAAAEAFEELTDAAARLMRSVGDFGLYSKTREQIAAGGGRRGRGLEAARGSAMAPGIGRTPPPGASASSGDALAASGARPPPPADAELDIYGEGEPDADGQTPAPGRPRDPGDVEPLEPGDVDGAAAQPPPATTRMGAEACGPGPQGPRGIGPLEGFQLDPGSGHWVNSSLGCTFDPATQLYGDVGSGAWFRWQDGQYHPVVTGPS